LTFGLGWLYRIKKGSDKMKRIFTLLILVFVLGLASASVAQDGIPLFIKGQSAEGFTDPSEDRRDSEKNLRDKLKDSKEFSLVETEEEAVMVLEVLDRAESQQHGPFAGKTQRKKTLMVRLTVGEFSTDFTGETSLMSIGGGWGVAAKSVVKQLKEWAKENSAKLKELSAQK
jgi:hypothetical protein